MLDSNNTMAKDKILIKNAIARKPKHLYWIDRWGSIYEEPVGSIILNPFEILKCKWIDFKRWFQ